MSMVLYGVVRATGAVMPPLIMLAIALWGIRVPFAYRAAGSLARGCDLVEFPHRLVGFAAHGLRVFPLRRMAQCPLGI